MFVFILRNLFFWARLHCYYHHLLRRTLQRSVILLSNCVAPDSYRDCHERSRMVALFCCMNSIQHFGSIPMNIGNIP